MHLNDKHVAAAILDQINHRAIAEVARMLSHETHKKIVLGGVLGVAIVTRASNVVLFASITVGLPGKSGGRFANNTAEKIMRLHQRRLAGHKDIAASESANPTDPDERLRTYGGCICFEENDNDTYISFSGAPPDVDEAIAFLAGATVGITRPDFKNKLVARAIEIYKGKLWEKQS